MSHEYVLGPRFTARPLQIRRMENPIFWVKRAKSTATSCPTRRRAAGRAPSTSERPPVFANGAASDETIRILLIGSGHRPILDAHPWDAIKSCLRRFLIFTAMAVTSLTRVFAADNSLDSNEAIFTML